MLVLGNTVNTWCIIISLPASRFSLPLSLHPPELSQAGLYHTGWSWDWLKASLNRASYPSMSIPRGKSLRDSENGNHQSLKYLGNDTGRITSSVFPYSKHTLTSKGRNHAPQPFKGRGPKFNLSHFCASWLMHKLFHPLWISVIKMVINYNYIILLELWE